LRKLCFLLGGVVSILELQSCQRSDGESKITPAAAPEPVHEVSCLGRIVPGDGIVKIAAPASSIVSELRVKRGSQVTNGDILAILSNHATALADLRQAEAQAAVAQVAIAQAQAPEKPGSIAAQEAEIARQRLVVQNAETEYDRRKKLLDAHLIAVADFASVELNLGTAREALRHETEMLASLNQVRDVDVQLAEKKLAAALADRDRAAQAVEQQIIRAPMKATVLQVYARPGETPGADGILDLGSITSMFVEAEVYATDIRRVHEGALASVTGEAFEGKLTGKVREILWEAGFNSLFPGDSSDAADKRVIRVRVLLDDPSKVRKLTNSQVRVRIAV
jgi:HlyD family secretion protein